MTHPDPPNSSADAPSPGDDHGADFDALVREHYGRLCNFAYRFVRSRDTAEDIVQDVLLRVWQRHSDFDFRDPLAYLYQAVRNRAVTHIRHAQVSARWRGRVEDGADPVAHGSSDASADVEAGDLAEAVARAVDDLPERCRLIFTMHREQGLSYGEIARVLGISIKTVETQMGRALKVLRTRLTAYLAVALAVTGW